MRVRQRRIPVAGHAAIAAVARVGVERLAGLMDRILEFAADGERDVVGAHLRHAQRDALRVRQAVAVLDRFLGQEAHADGKILAHGLAHARHHLAEQAQAAFERAAVIFVAALVVARQKRGERVGVRGMEFHAIVSGLARARGGGGELVDDAVDLGGIEHVDGLAPAGARHFHEVDDLRHDLRGAGIVHAIDQLAMAGEEFVVGDAQQRAGFRAVDGHRLDHDQADMAARIAHVAVDDAVVDEAVLAGEPRDHRGHEHPVGDGHRVDGEGLEELHRISSLKKIVTRGLDPRV